MTSIDRAARKFNLDIREHMHMIRTKLRECDEKIAERERNGKQLSARHATLYPERLVFLFDAMHNTGFTYRNRPFWRTTVGFLACVAGSWVIVEILQFAGAFSGGLLPPFSRLFLSVRYDYQKCDLCHGPKHSWESTLCSRCREDFQLGDIEDRVRRDVRDAWNREQERRKTLKERGTSDHCRFCDGVLIWHDGWGSFVCPSHGDLLTQSYYVERKDWQELYESSRKLIVSKPSSNR